MAIKTRAELVDTLNTLLGDNASDDALNFMGDMTDTIADLEEKSANPASIEKAIAENDMKWRQKMVDKFAGRGSGDPLNSVDDDPHKDEKPLTYEALFKEE